MKALTAALAGAAALVLGQPALAQPAALQSGPIQVVELYTSQGCSSCPPADLAVAAISARPEILALSFGVTYWDDQGWKDTFAQQAFTDRQWAYARGLRHNNVGTPQVVVNGRTDTVGQSVAEIDQALRAAALPAGGPQVGLTAAEVSVSGAAPAKSAAVWLVRYDPKVEQVPVKRGENNGKTLPIKNAVRQLVRLGEWSGGEKRFALPKGPPDLKAAVLLQAGPGGPILAAAKG
ncbi:thioredoxin family protein [Phenylobacterium sp.]|uniref:DUF1223 domain-containing protein n=1 Tax=Phenylobacterium sp. TaxID=1871053 RepID=UPI00121558F8|nr:DUF1223 domain-containing protein [Phenylobacterium sp.]THD58806.1 MAG: DUF1223 domain-containing protein [Phenylobacterium sp.]